MAAVTTIGAVVATAVAIVAAALAEVATAVAVATISAVTDSSTIAAVTVACYEHSIGDEDARIIDKKSTVIVATAMPTIGGVVMSTLSTVAVVLTALAEASSGIVVASCAAIAYSSAGSTIAVICE